MARTRRRRGRGLPDPDAQTRPPLDINRIVQAALDLLDDVGLAGLSMRHLAERLEVQAGTLYWYIRDKHELLSLAAEAICAEVQPPDPNTSWRIQLEALMWEYRRVLLKHRDAALVLAATLPAGAHRLRLVDVTLAAMVRAGFEGWAAVRAGRLLVDYTTGFVQDEYVVTGRSVASVPGPDADPLRLPTFADISAQAYPSIAALGAYLLDADGDARFAFGLGVVLDGLEQRAHVTPGPGSARSGSSQNPPTSV